jgi:hypothetical protein
MKNREDIVQWIFKLEAKYPVNTWRINDVWIWPILRQQIAGYLIREIDNIRDEKIVVKQKNLIRRAFEVVMSGMSLFVLRMRQKKTAYLFSGTISHRVDFNGHSHNRYFDPLMDYLEERGETAVLVEYANEKINKQYYEPQRVLFLADYLPFFRVLQMLGSRQPKLELDDYNAFLKEIEQNHYIAPRRKRFEPASLVKSVDRIRTYARVYRFLMQQYKTRVALGLCYYNKEMFALNLAASEMGAVSVDMQHGAQGSLHFAYANWRKHPAGGFNLLPELFWVWDETTAVTLREWISQSPKNRVVVGGNPWVTFTAEIELNFPIPANVILYTLQPAGVLLDKFIIDAIKQTKDQFTWWLRLHPRQKAERSKLVEILGREELSSHVNIDEAFSLPLPYILAKSKAHISKFSGSIQESVMVGTPTVIIHPIGEKIFRGYIDSGLAVASLSESAEELVAKIEESISRKVKQTATDFRPALEQLITGQGTKES